MGLANKLLGVTLGALSMGFDAVRHVTWFVSYQVARTTRDVERPEES